MKSCKSSFDAMHESLARLMKRSAEYKVKTLLWNRFCTIQSGVMKFLSISKIGRKGHEEVVFLVEGAVASSFPPPNANSEEQHANRSAPRPKASTLHTTPLAQRQKPEVKQNQKKRIVVQESSDDEEEETAPQQMETKRTILDSIDEVQEDATTTYTEPKLPLPKEEDIIDEDKPPLQSTPENSPKSTKTKRTLPLPKEEDIDEDKPPLQSTPENSPKSTKTKRILRNKKSRVDDLDEGETSMEMEESSASETPTKQLKQLKKTEDSNEDPLGVRSSKRQKASQETLIKAAEMYDQEDGGIEDFNTLSEDIKNNLKESLNKLKFVVGKAAVEMMKTRAEVREASRIFKEQFKEMVRGTRITLARMKGQIVLMMHHICKSSYCLLQVLKLTTSILQTPKPPNMRLMKQPTTSLWRIVMVWQIYQLRRVISTSSVVSVSATRTLSCLSNREIRLSMKSVNAAVLWGSLCSKQ